MRRGVFLGMMGNGCMQADASCECAPALEVAAEPIIALGIDDAGEVLGAMPAEKDPLLHLLEQMSARLDRLEAAQKRKTAAPRAKVASKKKAAARARKR